MVQEVEHWESRSFHLEIKVEGFVTREVGGRKSYTKGKDISWDVEIRSFSLDLLLTRLANELKWGLNQHANILFFSKILLEDVNLVEEEQMFELFDMYKSENHCQLLVVVCDNNRPLCVLPSEVQTVCDLTPEAPTSTQPEPNLGDEASAFEVADLEGAAAEEADALLPEIFNNMEEYVGVDDEHMYFSIPPTKSNQTDDNQNANNQNQNVDNVLNAQPHSSELVAAKGVISLEVEVNDAPTQTFRKAVRHYAVIRGFEFAKLQTDTTRFIARCAHPGCPWRIHASRIHDQRTIQIKTLPTEHNCPPTKLKIGKMATQGWCADRLSDWLKKNPHKGPKDAKEKLEEDYEIKLKYSKAWSGMKLSLNQIHGKYEESFQLLYNWKAQMEINSPGSIIEIEVQKIGKRMCFKRIFVALAVCVDGFLRGCRPYIGVDSTTLSGTYTGQLTAATAVDGHNWLFHLAFAIFDSETEDNWRWFMIQLRRAIGCPPGLVISTDACKGLETATVKVFPEIEHRECMRHMYGNFIKKYSGPVFTEHLYPAARSYTEDKFRWHMEKIYAFAPEAIEYLQKNHKKIWYRCGFSEESKCDYLTNNVSESFNSQINGLKGLLIHELVDSLRELIMEKRHLRRLIGKEMAGTILPNVLTELNAQSNRLRVVKVARSDEEFAKITLVDADNVTRRHQVDLMNHKCSCREWQITGKPCRHALAWILSNRGLQISDFVHEFYSIEKFRTSYEARVETMPDRTQWPTVDLGFKVWPPKQKRAAGRPKVQRIRGVLEGGAPKKKVKCKRCGGFGHFEKTCKLAETWEEEEPTTPKKRKR